MCACVRSWGIYCWGRKNDKNVYKGADFKSKIVQDLAETSYDILKSLKRKGKIPEKELKYFTVNH